MPQSLALCAGINEVDPDAYSGGLKPLEGAENDMKAMMQVAKIANFKCIRSLNGPSVTRDAILDGIGEAAGRLAAGDIFLLGFSGHGGLHQKNEEQHETICCFDGPLVDIELRAAWRDFEEGVRILVVADSCFSGTITHVPAVVRAAAAPQRPVPRSQDARTSSARARLAPQDVIDATIEKRWEYFGPILTAARAKERKPLLSTVLLLAACQELGFAFEKGGFGVFTKALIETWNKGSYPKPYGPFLHDIEYRIRKYQTPNYLVLPNPDPAFECQRPFTV